MRDNTREEVDRVINEAKMASSFLRKIGHMRRAELMHKIADHIELLDDKVLETVGEETNLDLVRLKAEKSRAVLQWRQYADGLTSGNVLDTRIDYPIEGQSNTKYDLRKTYIPLGIVLVFGASNFPFAYATGGGDTASAIAAGCPVIVKAHPAHPLTSKFVADAIAAVVDILGYPKGIFGHVYGNSFEMGRYLASHPDIKAVGFTGSLSGGRALFDIASSRKEPIPVFAEMGSVNPVFILRNIIDTDTSRLAKAYVDSLKLGSGQFCTNPGILCIPESEMTASFVEYVREALEKVVPAKMLHQGIFEAYVQRSNQLLNYSGVEKIYEAEAKEMYGYPVVVKMDVEKFISEEKFQQEVFGPFGVIIVYHNMDQLTKIVDYIHGQLTCSLLGSEKDFEENRYLVDLISNKCGRINFNSLPTGVQVDFAMQHGGPYPATTDSRFTAVGPDAIRRFVRPLAFQNCPDHLLPEELKNDNPLKIYRLVNGSWTKDVIRIGN